MLTVAERAAGFWALLGGAIVVAIMAVTSVNVGAFALDRIVGPLGGNVEGLPGYEDFVRLAAGCAALMFLPWCQAQRGHVSVDLFVSVLPSTLRGFLDRLWLFGLSALALFLAWWMSIGMLETRDDNALTPILGWPEWPFYAPGIASLVLWAAVALAQGVAGERDA